MTQFAATLAEEITPPVTLLLYLGAAVLYHMWLFAADMSDSDESCRLVSEQLSQFFSHLTISLQGIQLTYDSMQLLSQRSGAGGDVLELHLKVAVVDFPPPNLDF